MKKCDRESARRRTDRHTHTHTQTQTDFIICPMLYAIAMGQIIIIIIIREFLRILKLQVEPTYSPSMPAGRALLCECFSRRLNYLRLCTVRLVQRCAAISAADDPVFQFDIVRKTHEIFARRIRSSVCNNTKLQLRYSIPHQPLIFDDKHAHQSPLLTQAPHRKQDCRKLKID